MSIEAKRDEAILTERYERRSVFVVNHWGEFTVLAPQEFVDELERLLAEFRPIVSRFAYIAGVDRYSRLAFAARHRPQVEALIERFKNLDA